MRKTSRYITTPTKSRTDKGAEFNDLVSVVLFSENHGYRMKSYGPISLMKIGGKTLIERQVDCIKSTFKNFEIILCSGFETQRIVEFVKDNFASINIRVVENQMHFNSNCCESARLCLANISNDKILFCNGGALINPEILRSIDYRYSTVLCQPENDHKDFDIGAIVDNGKQLVSFGLGVKFNLWTEIFYICKKKYLKELYSTTSSPDYKNKFMFEAINELAKTHPIVVKVNESKPVVKVNNLKTLKRVNTYENVNTKL